MKSLTRHLTFTIPARMGFENITSTITDLVTESGILAAAHLSGPGNVKKYLRSSGRLKFKDAFGTSIESYLISFSKYDLSNIFPERYPKINSY